MRNHTFLWLSVNLQYVKNNSAIIREVGSIDADINGLLNVISQFVNNFLRTYIAHETQKMQSLFTFFQSSSS